MRRFDGEYRRFLIATSALRDASGQIVKWCGVNTDVEDRRQGEEALRTRERFRAIVDDLPAMVTLMTPDGEFADGNRHMLEYFGAPLEELKRRPTTESFHPDDRPGVDARWKESVETGCPYDFEARLRRADGMYRWFHTRGFPLRDAEGRIVLWHLLQTDVDERKRAEDALRESERNLKLIIDTIPALAWSARPDGIRRVLQSALPGLHGPLRGAGGRLGLDGGRPSERPERCRRGVAAHHGFGNVGRSRSAPAPPRR